MADHFENSKTRGQTNWSGFALFSSPGQSPGRAIVLPPTSALALALAAVSVLAEC